MQSSRAAPGDRSADRPPCPNPAVAQLYQKKSFNSRALEFRQRVEPHQSYWSTQTKMVFDAIVRLVGERPNYLIRASQVLEATGWGSLRRVQLCMGTLIKWGFLSHSGSRHSPWGSSYSVVGLHQPWNDQLDDFEYRGEVESNRLKTLRTWCMAALKHRVVNPFRKTGGLDVAQELVDQVLSAWNHSLSNNRYEELPEAEIRSAFARVKSVLAEEPFRIALSDSEIANYLLRRADPNDPVWRGEVTSPLRVALSGKRLKELAQTLRRQADKQERNRKKRARQESRGRAKPSSRHAPDAKSDRVTPEMLDAAMAALYPASSSQANATMSQTLAQAGS